MTENDFKNTILESTITPNAKFVCFMLLHYRNRKTGACYPSHRTLSQATGLCENTVRKATQELKLKGFVDIKQKRLNGNKFTSNIYDFRITPSMVEASNEVSNEVSNDTSQDGDKPIKPIKPINTPLPPKGEPDGFEYFWNHYPKIRAGSKDKARTAYAKALNRATKEEINNGMEKYRRSREGSGKFSKGAAAWLNDDRWTTDYAAAESVVPIAKTNGRTLDELKKTIFMGISNA